MNGTAPAARLLKNTVRWPCSLLLSVWLGAAVCAAQDVTDGHTPSGMAPGAPAGSYALSGFDTINFFNGSLNFSLPLLKVGGRGSSGHTISLKLERKWSVHKGPASLFIAHAGGWQSIQAGYGAGALEGRLTGVPDDCNQEVETETLLRMTFTAPDGTEYELRDAATNGEPGRTIYGPQCLVLGTPQRGRVFKTSDGTSATFVSDVDVTDANGEGVAPSGHMLLRDGTRFRVNQGKIAWARDRNGNLTTFTYTGHLLTQVTDSLGRAVTISYHGPGQTYDQLTYSGFGGAQRTLKVHYARLGSVLRPGSGYTKQTYHQLFQELNGASDSDYDPEVVSSVELPDGQRHYRFKYNPYGELARVELPTGGAFEYDWGAGRAGDPASGVMLNQGSQIYRRLLERRVYPDGTTGGAYASRMMVGRAEDSAGGNLGYVAVEQRDSTGALLTREEHYFHGSAVASMGRDALQYGRWREGRESETRLFDVIGGAPVLTKVTQNAWQQPAAGQAWPLAQAETDEEARPNDPQVTRTLTTLADTNQVSKQEFAYDRYSNRTDVWEYDYGAVAGQPGPLVRRSQTQFLTINPVGGADYASPNPTAASVHLRSLPSRQSVYDGANNEVARTAFEYDNYTQQAGHAPLTPRDRITGLCDTVNQQHQCVLSNPTGFAARGNVTAVTRYADAAALSGAVTTFTQYDVAGNVVKTIDPKGYESTVGYGDSFCNGAGCGGTYTPNAYAFPTSTTSPVPDVSAAHGLPAGTLGSTSPLTASTVYDFWTGAVTSTTDANGKVTATEYDPSDGLDRLKAVVRPDGGRTDYEYGDQPGGLYLRTLADLDDTGRRLKSEQYFDGLGRPVRSFTWENQEAEKPWLTADTEYDALGRAWRSSLPYRSTGPGSTVNPSGKWTETAFDALGRVRQVKTTADNAAVTTAYSGNLVTVTDQDGKARSSRTDALGRLVEVTEAPGVAGYGYVTSYQYDALGNLRKVDQGGQHRHFMYDSLGRLLRARNPEQGVTTHAEAPPLTDPLTGNSQWSLAYAYDANGNLVKRIDARNVKAEYAYDRLNRGVTVNYFGETTTTTPAVTRHYDQAANGKGRAWKSETSLGSRTIVNSYDAAGRPTSQDQQFYWDGQWRGPYSVQRSYDRAGNVTWQQYPSGRSVSYRYDAAGRLADSGGHPAFTGNLGDGTQRTYSSEVLYHELGGRWQEKFGTRTPLYNKSFYNVRGQLSEIRVGLHAVTEADPLLRTDWDRGAIINHYSHQTWAGSGTDNNGNLRKQEVYVPDGGQGGLHRVQFYDYDALNRLTGVFEADPDTPGAPQWRQGYAYDRWGNRRIDAAGTWLGGSTAEPSPLVPEPQFELDPSGPSQREVPAPSNRLYAPGDSARPPADKLMRYDEAGNLVHDAFSNFSGGGSRTYDAENRMVEGQWFDSQVRTARYAYDADGRRVRRDKGVGGRVWQVYGLDGELLAEYPEGGRVDAPQVEYGYRSGELLVKATAASGATPTPTPTPQPTPQPSPSPTPRPTPAPLVNLALGRPAAQSTDLHGAQTTTPARLAVDGDAAGALYGGSTSATEVGWHQWWEVDLGGTYQLDAVEVWPRTDCCPEHTSNFYVLVSDEPFASTDLQATLGQPGVFARHTPGNASRPTSAPVGRTGRYVRVQLAGYGILVLGEVRALGAGSQGAQGPASDTPTTGSPTEARAAQFVTQSVPSVMTAGRSYQVSVTMRNAGAETWAASSDYKLGSQSPQDNSTWGLGRVDVPTSVPYGSEATFSFTVVAPREPGAYRFQWRMLEEHVMWFGEFTPDVSVTVSSGGGGVVADVQWVVHDQLGTPRMVIDESGSLAGVKRRDYFPFGEEIGTGVGGRTTAQGYGQFDGLRQQYVGSERDGETSLDFMQARYYASQQGRFTSPDPLLSSGRPGVPQSWNRYVYTLNNPLKYIDPTGLFEWDATLSDSADLDKKERERRRKLRDAFTNARNSAIAIVEAAYKAGKLSKEKYDAINDALNAYGAEGEKNGVTVGVGTKDGEPGSTDPLFPINDKWNNVSADIQVKFDEKFLLSNQAAVAVVHEGAHVQDAFTFASNYARISALGADGLLAAPENMRQWDTENHGFRVQSYYFEVLGKNDGGWGTWQTSWAKLDAQQQEGKRREAITGVLGRPPYALAPDNKGWSMVSRICRPCSR